MATVQGLRTGQRPLLPNPRQEGRKCEPSRSARQEGGEPDTSYPQGAQSLEALRSETVLMDRHVTSRSNPGYGVYRQRYNTSIKAETDRRNHHEMLVHPWDVPEMLASLGNNGLIRHLVLEDKRIGLAGAAALSQWALNNPGDIETWFLAGSYIDAKGLERLVSAWIFADNITNIWLRRNPLGPESAYMLSILIKNSPKLRTLDLEQTKLGDHGVADLFGALLPLQTRNVLEIKTPVPPPNSNSKITYGLTSLSPIWIKERGCGEEVRTFHPPTTINTDELTYKSTVALRNIYLNAVGAGGKACWSVGLYLAHSLCPIESLNLCNNPLGHAGAIALAKGLASNHSLLRLNLASCDLTNEGVCAIFRALKSHPRLRSLGVHLGYMTIELGSQYNFFDDGVKDVLETFIVGGPQTLRLLDLGFTAMSVPAIESLAADVTRSDSLVVFYAKSAYGNADENVSGRMQRKLYENRQRIYGVDDATFSKTERRWLMDPKDADFVDSIL